MNWVECVLHGGGGMCSLYSSTFSLFSSSHLSISSLPWRRLQNSKTMLNVVIGREAELIDSNSVIRRRFLCRARMDLVKHAVPKAYEVVTFQRPIKRFFQREFSKRVETSGLELLLHLWAGCATSVLELLDRLLRRDAVTMGTLDGYGNAGFARPLFHYLTGDRLRLPVERALMVHISLRFDHQLMVNAISRLCLGDVCNLVASDVIFEWLCCRRDLICSRSLVTHCRRFHRPVGSKLI